MKNNNNLTDKKIIETLKIFIDCFDKQNTLLFVLKTKRNEKKYYDVYVMRNNKLHYINQFFISLNYSYSKTHSILIESRLPIFVQYFNDWVQTYIGVPNIIKNYSLV